MRLGVSTWPVLNMMTAHPRARLDPFRILEYPAAIFCLNITIFTVLWKSVGLSWMPFGLADRFQEIFANGYYQRDMEHREEAYRLFFLLLYGVLGTAAQIASLKIASARRKGGVPRVSRLLFGIFHLLIATYHVLFVFQVVQGKLILDGMAGWQLLASKTLYVLELVMAMELLLGSREQFFRRKVCLDVLSACNLVPFLVYWGFTIGDYREPHVTKTVEYTFFALLPLSLMLIEWATWCRPWTRASGHSAVPTKAGANASLMGDVADTSGGNDPHKRKNVDAMKS